MIRDLEPFSADWLFCGAQTDPDPSVVASGVAVHLPHNAEDLPFNYFDERAYQQTYLYQRTLAWRDDFADKEVSLVFDGAMADARVYLNGTEIAAQKDGYTPFEVRLTGLLLDGDNLISVVLSGVENPDIPPFGGQIDYLTYAGLYREVWLKIVPTVSIASVKIEPEDVLSRAKSVAIAVRFQSAPDVDIDGTMTATIMASDGTVVARGESRARSGGVEIRFEGLEGISLWQLDDPVLYTAEITVGTDTERDRVRVPFGFRTAEFTANGFYFNGRALKLRGLNRHQSFPYIGYAFGRRAQERDAEIVKHELKCNIVRTSHYPQSKWFLDHCDRIGLLVFEEIPGWQHIGGPDWKQESLATLRRMIERDWNHPSIILWGVRINESADDRAFYAQTNRLARSLDPTRATGGVRCIEKSDLLEDVYTMNDFSMGAAPGFFGNHAPTPLRSPAKVTGLSQDVPYLVTEFNGHMYPTKRFDQEERQAEHVMRHLAVLNAAYADRNISGAIGWCMADYNTHNDFGSGDRICYHGVLDMFREPKFAAWVYKSQCDPSDEIVLKPVTYWARGERAIGGILPLIVLTNCDEVGFRYGDSDELRFSPDRETFPHLPRPPVIIDERFVTPEMVGDWGMSWKPGHFVGYVGGQVAASHTFSAAPVPEELTIAADHAVLSSTPKDVTRIALHALDEAGNLMPYMDEVVSIDVQGPAKVVGPDVLTLRGGTAGFWIETTGGAGDINISAFGQRLGIATVQVRAED